MAVHKSALKLNLRSWVLAQGIPSPEGKLAKSRKPPRPWHYALCHLLWGEPSAEHLLLTLCSHEIKTQKPNLHKLLIWFSSSLLNFIKKPDFGLALVPADFQFLCHPCLVLHLLIIFPSPVYPKPSFMDGHLKYLIEKPFVLHWNLNLLREAKETGFTSYLSQCNSYLLPNRAVCFPFPLPAVCSLCFHYPTLAFIQVSAKAVKEAQLSEN